MLFNKYQYDEGNVQKRGYSENVIARNENDNPFWVKWILGIEKSSTKTKILTDKFRHLQKERHECLPEIVEYGFDDERSAFAVVYVHLDNIINLEDRINGNSEISLAEILVGFREIITCFQSLQSKKIAHGDLHPANILVGADKRFYVVDFSLADITRTLSQTADLEIFARAFAAPEKIDKIKASGFPYQADIYSFGKIIEWLYNEKKAHLSEENALELQKMLAEEPSKRLNWQQVDVFLQKLIAATDLQTVRIAFNGRNLTSNQQAEILDALQQNQVYFDISPKEGDNIMMNIFAGNNELPSVLWIKNEKKLLFNQISRPIADKNKVSRKKLAIKIAFCATDSYIQNQADLTPYFERWFQDKQTEKSMRERKRSVSKELEFYKELVDKELEEIQKNALKLKYSSFETKDEHIYFTVEITDKTSDFAFIQQHIDIGNAPDTEGVLYEVAATADRKQIKKAIEFSGKPYDLQDVKNEKDKEQTNVTDKKRYVLRIKDCENLRKDSIPVSGWLFESTRQKEEEKRRQKEALQKVDKNEVQSPDLLYRLFNPTTLEENYTEFEQLATIYQKDENEKNFEYSYNQTNAIQNALKQTPLSIIQGPPGTGKTTVITEIVFQLLAQKPSSKILITSQTNSAVDQVLENLLKNNIPLVRLSGITKPKIKAIQSHTIDKKMSGWKQTTREASEKKFESRKSVFLNELAVQNQFAFTIVQITLEQKDWQIAKNKIETIAQQKQDSKGLQHLPDDKKEAMTQIDSILSTRIADFIVLHDLHRDWVTTINAIDEKSKLNAKLVDTIRVVGATCNHVAAKKYQKYNFEFDYVIMDESGKAHTAEALVPIIMGKNLIFVGDHRQLKPMLTANRSIEKWLREKYKKESSELESWDDYFNRPSLFETVISGVPDAYKAQLEVCRRSSKAQIALTSKHFYEAAGDEAIQAVDRPTEKEHNLPLAVNTSILFIDIGSQYKNHKDGNGSSKNEESARIIPEILELLDKYEKIQTYSIGVITGYTAQLRLLRKTIDKKRYQGNINKVLHWKNRKQEDKEDKFSISVFDRFQGLERDIVIVDLVKSGAGLHLGFLEVPNRINVALSRQKRLLIIVGDYSGIINAKTHNLNGEKAALQHYLEGLKPEWIIKPENLKQIFK